MTPRNDAQDNTQAHIAQLNARIAELEQKLHDQAVEKDALYQQSQIQLNDTQHMLQLVLDNLPQAVFWKDTKLNYMGCNRAFAHDAGLASPHAIVGKSDYDMPWTDQVELFRKDDRQVIATHTGRYHYEEPISKADGTTGWTQTSKIPLCDASDQVVGVLGMYEDITQRKKIEEDLLVFKALANNAPDAIGIAAPDGIVTYANPAFRDMFGYGDDTIGFVNVQLFTEDDQRERIPALLQQVVTKGSWTGFLTGQRKDGSTFPALLSPFAIFDAERNVLAVPAIVRDMTEHHEQQQERSLLQQQVIEAQRNALRELSAPLLPISDHTVIMPLVGSIDTQRSQQIMETLLDGVARHQAHMAIIDITGVSVVDTQVANALIQAAQAVRLLGAQVMLTGIGPVMAQTLVHLGADLSTIITRSTLQSGIAYAREQRA